MGGKNRKVAKVFLPEMAPVRKRWGVTIGGRAFSLANVSKEGSRGAEGGKNARAPLRGENPKRRGLEKRIGGTRLWSLLLSTGGRRVSSLERQVEGRWRPRGGVMLEALALVGDSRRGGASKGGAGLPYIDEEGFPGGESAPIRVKNRGAFWFILTRTD